MPASAGMMTAGHLGQTKFSEVQPKWGLIPISARPEKRV